MDKGWDLTLDNSSARVGFSFLNTPSVGSSLTPRLNHHTTTSSRRAMFSGTQYPVSSPTVADENRAVVGELDFFSKKKNDHQVDSNINNNIVVKKENLNSQATPRNDLDVNTRLHLVTANTGSDQSTVDDGISSSNGEDKRAKTELAQLQGELEQMNVENRRLRGMLSQVSNNYNALQMHLVTLMHQQQISSTQNHENVDVKSEEEKKHEAGGVMQFLDLGPSRGATVQEADQPSHTSSEERTQSGSPPINTHELSNSSIRSGKRMGMDENPESGAWAPNKVPRLMGPKSDDQATEATMRKARVSVRARSEAPMITDGCQWRKYGQKMAKGNPCPRAYYRCTMAVGCPVRKQVQRCAEDRTILITTYEGNHNHPLPPAAMAMASTTSAAASMLLSGSMSSADGLMNPNFLARTILPYSSSMATISASAPFPTVTLDLTQTPNPLQAQRPSPQFQGPFASGPTPSLPHVLNQPNYNQSNFSGLHQSPPQQLHQTSHPPHPLFADTLSAATAAITADPNFTAALAAAISSIMGGNGTQLNNTTTSSQKTSSFSGN